MERKCENCGGRGTYDDNQLRVCGPCHGTGKVQVDEKQRIVELLSELLSRMNGCNNTDCHVCKSTTAQIVELGQLLGWTTRDLIKVTPFHLIKNLHDFAPKEADHEL